MSKTLVFSRYEGEEPDEEQNEKTEQSESPADALTAKFLKTRQILLTGEVNKALAEKIIRQLLILEADSDEPIRVFIDSPGGDVDAGYAIFDMIRFINAPVYTIGMGLVASAGALILLASPRERRIALPNSHYLIHQPLSGIKGVATDIEIHAAEIEKVRVKINKLIADETGTKLEQVEKDTDRDYWMNAEEAQKYGLIGKIAFSRKDLS
ncbi:MAG TPA: ATP-dependent Clp protease proteolytic subunit [Treponemataceae bacterium]|jgi:ATP-dependent Clp protease, protease subunit|nr:ATP-dependent Clp protease proteolytic subunit [Spirochaetaceae bacterium]HOS30412.1 ATP-dependent Clp protease proteolytic subunit [Treponemataceae bacterium]